MLQIMRKTGNKTKKHLALVQQPSDSIHLLRQAKKRHENAEPMSKIVEGHYVVVLCDFGDERGDCLLLTGGEG